MKKIPFFTLTLLIIFTLGLSKTSQAQNQVIIDSLNSALKTAKGTQRVDVWNALGYEYYYFNPEKSLEYSDKALSLSQKESYGLGVGVSMRHSGLAYRSQGDFTQALKHFYIALSYLEQADNLKELGMCLNDIGEVYKSRADYKQSIEKYSRAVAIFEKISYKEGTATALSNLAAVYYKWGKYKAAREFALKSMDIAGEIGTNASIEDASLILSDIYADLGNYAYAYKHYRIYTDIKDSVFRVSKSREITLIENKHEKERKETEAKMQQQIAEQKAKSEKEQRDNIQYSLIFIFFVGLFISIFIIGKFDIPSAYVKSLIFLTLLLVFRFVLIILTSATQTYTEGAPIFILGANVILALMFMPLHKFLEQRLEKRVIEDHKDDEKVKLPLFNKANRQDNNTRNRVDQRKKKEKILNNPS